ncbi:MAG: SPFH domain-containing protein [Deltaproteobacteria bacterium]|nr:SPFH domain-containing protein [Deltaproteobacteria bacterium]
MDISKQLRSVIQWIDPDPDSLFERWTDNGDEIKNASQLIVGPGQGCLFVYEGKLQTAFLEEGSFDLRTGNVPFWTTIKHVLYSFESRHKVGIYFFRKAEILNKRWGTPSPITYLDPQYRFPVGLGAFGNYSIRLSRPEEFFRRVVAGAHLYTAKELQKVILSRIGEPISTYLASAGFSYAEIDKHRSEIASHAKLSVANVFEDLGFELLDLRIEGTSFDAETQERIGKISDMTAEAMGIRSLGVDYVQYQQLQAMRDLSKNEGSGNLGMQIGLGAEMAKMFTQGMAPNPAPAPAVAPAAPVVAANNDPTAKLIKLKQLFDAGLIDESEYKTKKQDLLAQL